MCMITQTLDRHQVVDYSTFIFMNELTFISQSPKAKSKAWLLLAPFNSEVWTCTFLSLGMLFLLMIVIIARQNAKNDEHNTLHHHPWTLSLYLLYVTGLLSVFVLCTAYGAAFYALLTLPQYEPPVDSLSSLFALISKDQRVVVAYAKNPHNDRFLNTTDHPDNAFLPLGQHYQRTRRLFQRLDQIIAIVEGDPRNVVIATRFLLATERYLKARLPLHIASVSFEQDILGWIAEKGSPLIAPFNIMYKIFICFVLNLLKIFFSIYRLRENGFFGKWLSNSLMKLFSNSKNHGSKQKFSLDILYSNPTTTDLEKENRQDRPLLLSGLQSIFYFFAFGIVSSILIAFVECFYKCLK